MIYEQETNGKKEFVWREDTPEKVLQHCDKWDEIVKKDGMYGVAKRIVKSRAYRIYKSRWPYDKETQIPIYSMPEELELAMDIPSPEEEAADAYDTEILFKNISPRQQVILKALREGKTSLEIKEEHGYNTDNAVRWHKHQVKKVMTAIKADSYIHYTEYVCRDCGTVFETENSIYCPTCGSDNLLKTGQRSKPVFDE